VQTQKTLYALGLTSLGILAPSAPATSASGPLNTVTECLVTPEDNGTRIVLTGTAPFKPEVKSYGGKAGTTIITLPGVWQAGRAGVRTVGKNGIAFIRCGQFSMKPSQQIRLVANHTRGFKKALSVDLKPSEDQTRWEIVLSSPQDATAEVPPIPAAPPEPLAFSVDTKALTDTAIRVASTRPVAPVLLTPERHPSLATTSLPAPRLSLASVLAISPKAQPITQTLIRSESRLQPFPARSIEPRVSRAKAIQLSRATAPKTVVSLPALPEVEKTADKPQAIVVPVARPTTKPPVAAAKPVTATPTAPAPTPAPAPPAPKTVEPVKLQENPLDRMVSLDVVNGELPEVLKLIAVQAKVNVVSGQGVNGKKVTISLQKVLLRDALDWVTRTSGLAYTIEGTSTVVVGTGQEIAQLKRTAQTPEAASATIPFYYAEADSLKEALAASFPNVTISVIKSSEESKKAEPEGQKANNPGQPGEKAPSGSPSSLGALKPRGGAIYVVGTNQIITEIRKTIEDTEKGLIEIAQRDADTKAERMRSYVTEVYEVKYVDPAEAAHLVLESIPNVIIRPGPSQRFIANSVGNTSAFSSAGGAGGATGGGIGGGASAAATPPPGNSTGGPVQGQGQNNQVESRILLVTGKPDDVTRAKEMLNRLDLKVPQFVFEARLVESNKDTVDQLGLKYDLGRLVNIGEKNFGESSIGDPAKVPARPLNGGAIFRTPYSISAQIDALATSGKANILARPTLSALDGNAATTFIGDQVPYIISQQQTPTGLNIQTGIANAGIRLQVSGRSNGDGTMTIYVHPEISTITSFVGGLPQISTRFVDTTIRVKDGETIAIGGLVRRQDIDNMRKLPGLGDLPVLGSLFRSSDKRKQENEVLIFITCSLTKD